MSKQANPFAIGAFLVGGLLLLVAAVMVFGGNNVFKDKNRFVIFFDSALNGLNVGAPVKLQGVQIGNVTEISLEVDSDSGRIFKPVVIEIDPGLVRDFSEQPDSLLRAGKTQKPDAQRLIEAGLKARLETQSLLTGLLYVDLNFYNDKPVYLVQRNYKGFEELPSVPTTVDEIRNTADEIINKAKQLPLEQMVLNLADTLKETRQVMQSSELKSALVALSKSMQETQRLMQTLNQQVGPLLTNVNGTASDTRLVLQTLTQQGVPVLKAAEQSLSTATRVLQDSQKTLNAVETLATPDSPLGQALQEMRDASRAMRDLSESLERHPQAILYGK